MNCLELSLEKEKRAETRFCSGLIHPKIFCEFSSVRFNLRNRDGGGQEAEPM